MSGRSNLRHVKSGKRGRLGSTRHWQSTAIQWYRTCNAQNSGIPRIHFSYSILPTLSATANLQARSEGCRERDVTRHKLCTSLLLHLFKLHTRCELDKRQTTLGQIAVKDSLATDVSQVSISPHATHKLSDDPRDNLSTSQR